MGNINKRREKERTEGERGVSKGVRIKGKRKHPHLACCFCLLCTVTSGLRFHRLPKTPRMRDKGPTSLSLSLVPFFSLLRREEIMRREAKRNAKWSTAWGRESREPFDRVARKWRSVEREQRQEKKGVLYADSKKTRAP